VLTTTHHHRPRRWPPVQSGASQLSGVDLGLLTSITDPTHAPAAVLAEANHQRWEHESGSDQLKTHLRGPAKILRLKAGHRPPGKLRLPADPLRPQHPDLPRGHRNRHRPRPDQFTRTVRIIRRRVTNPAAFPPEHQMINIS